MAETDKKTLCRPHQSAFGSLTQVILGCSGDKANIYSLSNEC